MSVRTVSAETIALALEGKKSGQGWMARCPAHEDHDPSLSIQEAADGKILVHCFAGCAQEAVLEALRKRRLWPTKPQAAVRQASRPPPATVAAVSQPSPPPSKRQSPQALWDGYGPVSPSHSYLARKSIGTHGARFAADRGALVLPLLDMDGVVHGLQYITVGGNKNLAHGAKCVNLSGNNQKNNRLKIISTHFAP